MAVVNVTKVPIENAAGDAESSSTAVLKWTVLMDGRDEPATAQELAKQAGGIPRVGDSHPADANKTAREVNARNASANLYEVEVRYQSDFAATMEPPGGGGGGPEGQAPDVEYFSVVGDEKADQDQISGAVMANTADEPFDPMSAEAGTFGIRITRNEMADPAAVIALYMTPRPSVSADEVLGFRPGSVKIGSISATRVRNGPWVYWRVTYELHVRVWDAPPGTYIEGGTAMGGSAQLDWKARVLNAGTRVKTGTLVGLGTGYKILIDEEGHPLTPQPLAADGLSVVSVAAAVWLIYSVNPRRPFAPLNLGRGWRT